MIKLLIIIVGIVMSIISSVVGVSMILTGGDTAYHYWVALIAIIGVPVLFALMYVMFDYAEFVMER